LKSRPIEFNAEPPDNERLANLCGPVERNIRTIAEFFDTRISRRGQRFRIEGEPAAAAQAREVLSRFWQAAGRPLSIEDIQLAVDIRTGVVITLVASFLMVAASVGVNQAAEILDRRELHASLHRLGMPMETVERARRSAIMRPLLLTAVGSALCAGAMILPLLGIALITAPVSLITIATVIAVGFGIMWLSTRVTRPILGRAFA